MERFRGGLVLKAQKLLYRTTLGSRVITNPGGVSKGVGLVFKAQRWLCHTTLGSRVMKNLGGVSSGVREARALLAEKLEREARLQAAAHIHSRILE